MKYTFTIFLLLIMALSVSHSQMDSTAQNNPWTHSLNVGLNLTQIALTDWAQGGENALAWTFILDGKSTRDWDLWNWANNYKFAFGQTRLGSQGLRKTEDKIDFESILTYKLGTLINPYAAATFKSQFAPGYVYDNLGNETPVSKFFDPAYLTQSFGAGYQPMNEIKTRLGVGLREIVTSDYNQYSDDATTPLPDVEKVRVEGGIEWVTDISWQIEENLRFTSKLETFSPLNSFDETTFRADNTLAARVSKYVTANLNLQLLNDKKVSPKTQFKETLAIGITYSIF